MNEVDKTETLRTIISYQASLSNRIEELFLETRGEFTPEIENLLKQLEIVQGHSLPAKVDAIHAVMTKAEHMGAHYADYEDMFKRLRQGWTSVRDRLKEYVKFNMVAWGMEDLIGEHFSYKLVNGQETLHVDTEKLPAEYLMQVTTMVPDKDRIKRDLKSGVKIPGAELVRSKALRVGAAKK